MLLKPSLVCREMCKTQPIHSFTNLSLFINLKESEVKVEQLHAISLCIEMLPPEGLDSETMLKITSVVEKVFNDHFERSAERAEQRKDEDFDEVVEQQLWDEMEDDNYILTKGADVIHAMLKVHKSNYLPYMDNGIIPLVRRLISPERYWQERQWGICIWDDMMEFTGAACVKYQQMFVPTLLSFLGDSSSEVRQAASYGCGIMAQFGQDAFASMFWNFVKNYSLILPVCVRK